MTNYGKIVLLTELRELLLHTIKVSKVENWSSLGSLFNNFYLF